MKCGTDRILSVLDLPGDHLDLVENAIDAGPQRAMCTRSIVSRRSSSACRPCSKNTCHRDHQEFDEADDGENGQPVLVIVKSFIAVSWPGRYDATRAPTLRAV
jgi:hypothetical protein